jgi:hypothetical protein
VTFPLDSATLGLNTFGADGTLVQSGPAGEGAGAWAPTGPASAEITLVLVFPDAGQPVVIHARLDVDAGAGTFDGTFTVEGDPNVSDPVHGARVVVGPVGVPSFGTPAA